MTTPDQLEIPKKTMTKEQKATAKKFFEANSGTEFQNLMLQVVEKKIPSPLSGFEPIDKENKEDNYWWKDSDEAYQMLKKINELGAITVNAQECDTVDPYNDEQTGVNCRTSLVMLCPIEMAKFIIQSCKNTWFDFILGDPSYRKNKNEEFKFPQSWQLDINNKIHEIRSSSLRYKYDENDTKTTINYQLNRRELAHFLNSTCIEDLLQNYVEITCFDWAYNRRAQDGLFKHLISTLQKYKENAENTETKKTKKTKKTNKTQKKVIKKKQHSTKKRQISELKMETNKPFSVE